MFLSRHFRIFFLACVVFFIFRTFYGLNNRFWDEDEKHIYLLGLELFSFHHWPHFGADIIHTATQIPGALQSFLVGLVFFIFPLPEAPFFIVNLLSLSGFILFALYLRKQFPQYAALTLLAWLTSLPWSLDYTTHVYNPSYLLLPEIVFFIALFESLPNLSQKLFSIRTALFLMGLCLGAMAQLHLSWPILLPFVLVTAWQIRFSWKKLFEGGLFFSFGFAIPCLLLIPTLKEYGLHSILQQNAENSEFHIEHLFYIFNNLIRLICYATYESFIFIGENTKEKQEFLFKMIVLVPMFFMLTVFAAFQIVYFIYALYKLWMEKNQRARTSILLFIFALLSSSLVFLFSTRPPVSRNLYLLFPLSLWCMFLSIDFLIRKYTWGKYVFHSMVCLSLLYHAIISYNRFLNYPQHSLYSNRSLLVKSLQDKNPYIFETPRYK